MTDSFGGHLETVLIDVKHLQAEVERLRAAFGPTIELLEDWIKYMKPYTGFINSVSRTKVELARLRAIVEKGTK